LPQSLSRWRPLRFSGGLFRIRNKTGIFSLAGVRPAGYPYSEDHTMVRPGERLRQARERLGLTYRDVAEASQRVAERRGSEEFAVALSRLADIENKGTLPTVYRLYTLCAIYRLDWKEVLRWYGVPIEMLSADALHVPLDRTHALHFGAEQGTSIPSVFAGEIDLNKTTFLSHMVRRWGKMPLHFLASLEHRHFQYGLVGLTDWSMHPVLQPGALVLIDQNRRKIAADGWTSEFDRPIYFLEHREGFRVGWCSRIDGGLLLHTHPSAHQPPRLFDEADIDVVGQVTGMAMLLEPKKRRHARTAATPPKSPNP
jgi:transcriptional regulator with XRE-family HTH domain